MLPVSKGASSRELRQRGSVKGSHRGAAELGSAELTSGELDALSELPDRDINGSNNSTVSAGHQPGAAAAGVYDVGNRGGSMAAGHKPIAHHWNWYAILLTLLYTASMVFYFYARVKYSMNEGPSFWTRFYSWLTLGVEAMGVTAMFPYALLLCRSVLPTGSPGLPAAEKPGGTAAGAAGRRTSSLSNNQNTKYNFHVRVMVPCYKEPVGVIKDTLEAALAADLPPGVHRTVYLCDDGKDAFKEALVDSMGPDVLYITGRKRASKETNGKSANLNNALKNHIYRQYHSNGRWEYERIPQSEVVVVFDADMAAKPNFFLKILEVLVDDQLALCLTPQAFHNIPADGDLFNNINLQFWEYWLPGATAWGYIACTGTNFAIRSSALAHVGWFPEYTITEDYALGFELKAHGYKGQYLLEYLAVGEAPDEIRNVFRQRSRWTKGHWQVFLSARCPLFRWHLPFFQKLWYSYGTWSYLATIITTPFFIAVPFISLTFGVHPLTLNTWVAAAITAYYSSIFLLQSYCRNLAHLQSLWYCQISNVVLWFVYTKAVINSALAQMGFKAMGFKVTEKKVVADGQGPPPTLVQKAVNGVLSFGRTVSNRFFSFNSSHAASASAAATHRDPMSDRTPLFDHDTLAQQAADRGFGGGDEKLRTIDSLVESGQGGTGVHMQGPASNHTAKMGDQKFVLNVHIHNKSHEDDVSVFARDQNGAAKAGRTAFKSAEHKSGLKRVFGVFIPKNIGDLGGVMDPYALLLLLFLSVASIGIGLYKAIETFMTPGASIWVASAFLGLPFCWAVNGAVAPYLFLHYCFTAGKSFKRAAAFLRGLQTLLTLASIVFLWIGMPAEIPVGHAMKQGVTFLAQQVDLIPANQHSDFASFPTALLTAQQDTKQQQVVANSAVTRQEIRGYLPSGSDPVKYSAAIAHTTAMLAWGLEEFGAGFDSAGRAAKADALRVVVAGADFLSNDAIVSSNPTYPVFLARVGDPARYITAGVTPGSVLGMDSSTGQVPLLGGQLSNSSSSSSRSVITVWADPAQELQSALQGSNALGRPALVVTKDQPGVDVVASSAAALAAAAIAVRGHSQYSAKEAQYLEASKLLYDFAKAQIAAAQRRAEVTASLKRSGLKAAFDPAQLSYCASGDAVGSNRCTFDVEAEQPVLLVKRAADDASHNGERCWVPDYSQSTCVPLNKTSECRAAQSRAGIFHRAASCCSAMQADGVWNRTTPAGICAVPAGQEFCYVPFNLNRTCIKERIGWQIVEADGGNNSNQEWQWTGCTGRNMNFYGHDESCCNALWQAEVIGPERPGMGVCARRSTTCYRFDLPSAQCIEMKGEACSNWEQQSFITLPACCNAIVEKIGGIDNLAGTCSGTAAAAAKAKQALAAGAAAAQPAAEVAGAVAGAARAAGLVPTAAAPLQAAAVQAGTGKAAAAAAAADPTAAGGRRLQQQQQLQQQQLQQQQQAAAAAGAPVPVSKAPGGPGASALHQQDDAAHTELPPSLLEGSGLNYTDKQASDRAAPEVLMGHSMKVTVKEHRFNSNSSLDDMAWAGVWLYKATGDTGYLGDAEGYLERHETLEAQGSRQLAMSSAYYQPNWANVNWGAYLLLSQLTDDPQYHDKIRGLLRLYVEQEQVLRSPQAAAALREISEKNVREARKQQEDSRIVMEDGTDYHIISGCIPQVNTTASNYSRLSYKAWEDNCGDGLDDDCDGLVDSDDPDCALFPVFYTSRARGLAWSPDEPAPAAAATSFLALVYSKHSGSTTSRFSQMSKDQQLSRAERSKLRCWALGQASFLLGDNPEKMSFVVGDPSTPAERAVRRPQHQASSCPGGSFACDWRSGFFAGLDNPRLDLAAGALVAGPDRRGLYHDDRTHPASRVGTHYNAAWVSALAGLKATGTDVKSCGQLQGVYQQIFEPGHLPQLSY